MAVSYARASRIASSCPKDFDFQHFLYQNEGSYPMWTNFHRIFQAVLSISDNLAFNIVLCVMTVVNLIRVSMNLSHDLILFNLDVIKWVDISYNAFYTLHCLLHLYCDCYHIRRGEMKLRYTHILNYTIDALSYVHYAHVIGLIKDEKLAHAAYMFSYTIRLSRPMQFLVGIMTYHLRGDVIGLLMKYLYFFVVIRVLFVNLFIWCANAPVHHYDNPPPWLNRSNLTIQFFSSFYMLNKMFIGLGPEVAPPPEDTIGRVAAIFLMVSGKLIVSGITAASMALIVGIFIRPEENFRTRFRIIMNNMDNTNAPQGLRQKVETFYRMYWHKQKAVSRTHLMPLFPPTLKHAINTDIFFEAMQKSRVLCDLSYQFLAEIAKFMQIIHYVPGDVVIKRKSTKSTMVYIAYGDVEMLTAEDDDTPILRFTRGSIMNPCGGCAEVASVMSHVSIRAATFCTAHVLDARDLWDVAAKYGKSSGQAFIVHSSFEEHFDKVKRHYATRAHQEFKHKSTIMIMKRNLLELKNAEGPDGKNLLCRTDMFLEVAGCYVMRNPENSDLNDDSDPICLRPTFPCILQSNSSLLTCWNMVVATLTVLVYFIYPYNFFYLKTITTNFRFFDVFMDFIFMLDIAAILSTGTKIEEGIPVTLAHSAMRSFATYWFAVDLISVLPLFYFIGDGRFAGLNKILKIFKVFRLLKNFEDTFIHSSNYIRFFCYVLANICIVYKLAFTQQFENCFIYDSCEVTSITYLPHWEKTEPNDGPTMQRFIYSIFWAISIMTMTTYRTSANIIHSYSEQVLITIVYEMSVITAIMLDATFSATIMVSSSLRDQYKTCINTVTSFLKKSNVDPILQYRFIHYLKLCWFTDKAYSITHNKNSILFDLPSHVYQEIMAMQRNKYLLCIRCMKVINKEQLRALCASARVFYTSPNEILQNTGEVINEIYVVKQGMCELVNPVTREVANVIGSKEVFGDVECLLRVPAFYTVRAVTHVQMVCISRKDVVKAINTPLIIDAIRFSRQSPEYTQLLSRQPAFLKYEIEPPPPNREFFPLPRKHEPDNAFLLPFTRLGFFAVLRYIFPRFTIRPDGKYMKRYEWYRCACAILTALFFPFMVILRMQWPVLYYVHWFLDLSAYFDIVQRMLVAYYDNKGILIYHPASTALHYIKGPFIVDLISCLPLEHLDSVRTIIYYDETIKGFEVPDAGQYLLYFKLGQLYRVPNALDILNDYIERQDVILVIKALPIYLALLCILTSLIVMTSTDLYKTKDGFELHSENDFMSTWFEVFADFVAYKMMGSPFEIVLTCFYWVTYEMTTVGYGVLQPGSMLHLCILVTGMLICYMMTTFVAVTVLSIRANVNQALASYQGHLKDMKAFMKEEAVPKELIKEVLSYYEYKWEKTGGTDYRTMLKLCDQISLRTDTILHIYGQTYHKCPLLFKADMSLLRIMGRSMRSCYYRQNMTMVERNQVISELYIIDYGMVEMRHADDDHLIVTKLPRGSIFGNLDNVPTALSRNRFVASSNLHLLKINASTFYSIIADFPSVKVLLLKFRPNDENFIIGSLRDQSVVASTFRERSQSSPMIEVSKDTMMKYLNVQSKGIQIALILISLCSVYGDLYNTGFQVNTTVCLSILYCLDALFVLKIVLNFALPYVSDEESESRIALVSSRKGYLHGEFKYDCISMIPFELIAHLLKDKWSYFAIFRLNRVLRIVTVYNGLQRYHQKLHINLTITTIASVIIWFTLFIHSTASVWFLMSIYEEDSEKYSSWIYKNSCSTTVPILGAKEKMNTSNCHMVSHCKMNYMCSVYFIISILTQNGVGDILPKQKIEVVFVCIMMICSHMLMMIYVGEFSNIIQYQSFRCFIFYTKYLELQDFLRTNRVSRNLVEMTKMYTLYLWRETRGYQTPEFLERAPQSLRLRVMEAAYLHHLTNHPKFEKCEPAFLRHLAGCFKPFLYVENMWVVKDAEITNSMYFVHRGRVLELDEEMERDLELYTPGTYFGTPHGLVRDLPYELSYKTVTKSQILTLKFDDWEYLLEHFPVSKNIIFKPKHEDEKDKKKKKLQITKAPEIRTIERRITEAGSGLMSDSEATATVGPWPLDTRRQSDEQVIPQSDIYEKESTQPWPVHRRKSSDELVPTKASSHAKAEEFSGAESTEPWPLRSRMSDQDEPDDNLDKYPKIKSHFPKSSDNLTDTQQPTDNESIEEPFIPSRGRRKSTFYGVEQKATNKELENIEDESDDNLNNYPKIIPRSTKSAETVKSVSKGELSSDEPAPVPQGRRKSNIYGIDKEATNKELESILMGFEYDEVNLYKPPPSLAHVLNQEKSAEHDDIKVLAKMKSDHSAISEMIPLSTAKSPRETKPTGKESSTDVQEHTGPNKIKSDIQTSDVTLDVLKSRELQDLESRTLLAETVIDDKEKSDVPKAESRDIKEIAKPKSEHIPSKELVPSRLLLKPTKDSQYYISEANLIDFEKTIDPDLLSAIDLKSPVLRTDDIAKHREELLETKKQQLATPLPNDTKIIRTQRSSIEEIEMRNISYSRDNLQKPTDIEDVGERVFLQPGKTESQASVLNEAAAVLIKEPDQKPKQTLTSLTSKSNVKSQLSFAQIVKSFVTSNKEDVGARDDEERALPDDEQNTEDLREKLENKIATGKKLNLEPAMFLDMNETEPKTKRSALSFRDEIATLEIPIYHSDQEFGRPVDSYGQSITTFIDDMAMKDAAAVSAQKPTDGRTDTSKSSVSAASSKTVVDVEDFMFKEAEKKKTSKRKSMKLKERKRSSRKRKEDTHESSDEDERAQGSTSKQRGKKGRWPWH